MTTLPPPPYKHIEQHPWNWYGRDDSTVLLVGTFPPTRNNWSFDFFYPNRFNFFWRLMAAIAAKPLQHFSGPEAVTERKALLDSLKITITDMGQTIARIRNNSSDENLVALAYMDIFRILEARPHIRKIIFTSSSGKASAATWFLAYLRTHQITHKFPKGARPLKSTITWQGRTLELVILYSPSPRAANRVSFEQLTALYKAELTT